MNLSTIALLVWVFLVTVAIRGWNIEHIDDYIFVAGLAAVILTVLEHLGAIKWAVPLSRRRSEASDR